LGIDDVKYILPVRHKAAKVLYTPVRLFRCVIPRSIDGCRELIVKYEEKIERIVDGVWED
jgi:uncharacterized membrane protein